MDFMKAEKVKIITRIAIVILLGINLYNYYTAKSRTVKIPPPQVIIEKPELIEMPKYVTQTGNTVAFQTVDLVARVEGYLNEIYFTDGSFVKKNKTLFLIEPETYLAQLKEAEATLKAAIATQTYDQLEYKRQQKMYEKSATSLSNVEKWLAKSQASAAQVETAKENLTIAQINYSYTQVKAPFDGRIGRHLVDKGNLVGHGIPTVLATIEQLDPIYVYFNLNEIDLVRLRAAAKAQGINEDVIQEVPVEISLQQGLNYHYQGKLNFVNTGLNASTGTLEFRALLPNPDYSLLPGFFVSTKIMIEPPKPRLTVPEVALQYDQVGPYLLIVDKQNRVSLKHVTLGPSAKNRRAITSGLEMNDQVIVNGLQNASVGRIVQPLINQKAAT